MGECDQCSGWVNHADMLHQMQWAGNKLIDTGLLVCKSCLDKPQDQYRSIILPPDPRPIVNPRPSPNVTGIDPVYMNTLRPYGTGGYGTFDYAVEPVQNLLGQRTPENQGFHQFQVGSSAQKPFYPEDKYSLLVRVAAITGIPIPPQIFDRSVTISRQNQSFPIMGTQPARGWILIYNPTNPQAQVSLSPGAPPIPVASMSISWGNIKNLILGPGEAFFAATNQGLGQCYQGAMAVAGLIPGMQFWAFESGYPFLWLTDDFGNLVTDQWGQAVPVGSPAVQPEPYFENFGGLMKVFNAFGWPVTEPSGPAVWNDATFAKVGPGSAPRNDAPPLFFGTVTPQELLLLGGSDLPWDNPKVEGQLWNPFRAVGGPIFISGNLHASLRPFGIGPFGTHKYGTWL
jgi:hypothetical protein